MARPSIYTPPVRIDTKQNPVDPTYYPLPNTLTPPPAEAPYMTVEAKQAPVDPTQSAIANALFGIALRGYQPPQGMPLGAMQPLPEPPGTHPAQYPSLQFGSRPLRPETKAGPYYTSLAPSEEAQFQAWVKSNHIPFDPSPTADYNMRGFFLDKPAMQEREARIAAGGSKHFPDTYKTPYHQSFSNESIYATPDAPHWEGDRLIDRTGRVVVDETPPAMPNLPVPPEPRAAVPSSSGLLGNLVNPAPTHPLRAFTEPPALPPVQSALPNLPEGPVPSAPPAQQILHSIGIPFQQHAALVPRVTKTFPKAIAPNPPAPVKADQPASPPKVFRATPTTVQDTMKFSPMRQTATPTGRKVVVSLPDKKVVVYDDKGQILREYSAYIGKASAPTPRGQFRIMENIKPNSAEWYYGGHWLGFAYGYGKGEKPGHGPSYAGIHGWVYSKEDEAGEQEEPGWKTSTHGCIQLGNKDVADLASLVGAGDPVTILDAPIAPPPRPMPSPQLRPYGITDTIQNLIHRSVTQ